MKLSMIFGRFVLLISGFALLYSCSSADEPPGRAWRYPGYDLQGSRVYPFPSKNIEHLGFDTTSVQLWRSNYPRVILAGDVKGDSLLEVCITVQHYSEIYDPDLNRLNMFSTKPNSQMGFLEDINNDGLLEIIALQNDSEDKKIIAYDFRGEPQMEICEHIDTETSLVPLCFIKTSKLIFYASTGYDRKPRGLFCHDIYTGKRIWHYSFSNLNAGDEFISAADINDDDLLDISILNAGPENGVIGSGGPGGGTLTYDDCTYTIIVNENGEERYVIRESSKSNNEQHSEFVKFYRDSSFSLLCYNDPANRWRPLSPSKVFVRDALTGELQRTFYGKTRFKMRCIACDVNGDGIKEIIASSVEYNTVSPRISGDHHMCQRLKRRREDGIGLPER
jgi:hypothetical protein